MICKYCGEVEEITKPNGPHTAAYCPKCASFIKFVKTEKTMFLGEDKATEKQIEYIKSLFKEIKIENITKIGAAKIIEILLAHKVKHND